MTDQTIEIPSYFRDEKQTQINLLKHQNRMLTISLKSATDYIKHINERGIAKGNEGLISLFEMVLDKMKAEDQ